MAISPVAASPMIRSTAVLPRKPALNERVADWLVDRFGRKSTAIAVVAGAALLGVPAFFLGGPILGAVAGAAGAFGGAVFFGLRP